MVKDTDDRLKKLEIEYGIEKGVQKWVRTICVTSTSMFLTFCVWLGGQIYDKWDALAAGIKAFLAAGGRGL